MNCICQRAYDTGFTGIPRVDARLAHRYEVYSDDCIKRSYDHYHFGIPYTDAPRRHYCFVSRTQTVCGHEACEHARHRPPTYVAKMRFYVESICPAQAHYPELTEGIDRNGDTRPEMDNTVHLGIQWDERQFQLHKAISFTPREPKLKAIPIEMFREQLVTALTGIDLDEGLPPSDERDNVTIAGAVTVLDLASTTAAELTREAFEAILDSDPQLLFTEALEYEIEEVAA